jgi:TetR/AcrR family transcriptional regulator, copper-responsive repressor
LASELQSVKRRGRPPAFNREAALRAAALRFWQRGFAATSLDDLVSATGMERPSLYRAFGDKREIFRKALRQHSAHIASSFKQVLDSPDDLLTHLDRMFDLAISLYERKGERPGGCFIVTAASLETTDDPEIASSLSSFYHDIDQALMDCLERSAPRGLRKGIGRDLARVTATVIFSLAIRARAGAMAQELRAITRGHMNIVRRILGEVESTRSQ